MTVKTGSAWAGLFVTLDATGALAAGTPSGVLYVDGTANGATVTITGSNPYKFSVTLPTLTAGQRVDMYITATIDSISTAGIVASEQADTLVLSDGVVVNSGTVTNLTNLPSIPNNWLTAAGIAADAGAEIADAVWDEAISGHTTAGSFGAKNQKVVPSETIGDYKADVSSLATSAALATVGNNVSAIKTKTDNLPSDPADDSDIDAQLAEIKGYVDDLESRLTATRAGYLDAAISTRLATSGYTSPPSVSDIATAVWGNATRTLSSFGTLIADIWGHATRTLSAFAFTVTGAKDTSVDAIKAKTDTIPASPAAVGSAMTLTVGERTAIANEVESQIIDDTDAEKVLKAITDKIASVNPSLDDLTLAGIASAVRTELTTELARIDAAISTRLATAGYTAPANADISTIKSKTNNLPASPAASGEYTSALSAIQADLDNPNQYKADVSGLATTTHLQEVEDKVDAIPASITAEDVMTSIVEGAITLRDSLKLVNAMNAGKVTGGKTSQIVFRDLADTLDRIIMTVDASGNRTTVTRDVS